MLFTSLSWSVLEKTVPSVLSAVLKTSGTVFPTRNSRLANIYIYIYVYIFQILISKKQRNNKNSEHENIYAIIMCVSRKVLKARLCLQSCL